MAENIWSFLETVCEGKAAIKCLSQAPDTGPFSSSLNEKLEDDNINQFEGQAEINPSM